jgi:hypothetical protein
VITGRESRPAKTRQRQDQLKKGTTLMDATSIQNYARQLFDAQGAKAIAEAAQKAAMFERHQDGEQAQTWRRIEHALVLLRGPRET